MNSQDGPQSQGFPKPWVGIVAYINSVLASLAFISWVVGVGDNINFSTTGDKSLRAAALYTA